MSHEPAKVRPAEASVYFYETQTANTKVKILKTNGTKKIGKKLTIQIHAGSVGGLWGLCVADDNFAEIRQPHDHATFFFNILEADDTLWGAAPGPHSEGVQPKLRFFLPHFSFM